MSETRHTSGALRAATELWERRAQAGTPYTPSVDDIAGLIDRETGLLDLLAALRCALADLEGIMPEFEPSGDRTHPAWTTIKEARAALQKAEGSAK